MSLVKDTKVPDLVKKATQPPAVVHSQVVLGDRCHLAPVRGLTVGAAEFGGEN